MTTNFALSLSSDGIKLLQRVSDGWHLVSETELDVPDLGAALSQMRDDALALDPTGLRTKVLIPSEQIKFITLETAQTSIDDVMSALEGATPYATSDLVVDFDRNGGRTFIAAVARETLDEAEAFATQYNFAPVSFAAIPEQMTFKGEVFFGPSSIAPTLVDAAVERDDAPVAVTGTAVLPAAELPPEEVPVFTPRPRMTDPASISPPDAPEPTAEAKPDQVPTPPVVKIDTPPEQPVPAPAVTIVAEDVAEKGGFASRRSAGAAPAKPQKPAKKAKPAKEGRKEKKAAAHLPPNRRNHSAANPVSLG